MFLTCRQDGLSAMHRKKTQLKTRSKGYSVCNASPTQITPRKRYRRFVLLVIFPVCGKLKTNCGVVVETKVVLGSKYASSIGCCE